MGLEPLGAPWLREWMLPWGFRDQVGFGLILQFQPQMEFGDPVLPPGLIPAGNSGLELGAAPQLLGVEDERLPGSAGINRDPLVFLGVQGESLEWNSRCSALPDRAWRIPGCPSFPCGSDPSWWIPDPGAEPGASLGCGRERPEFSGISLLRGFGMLRVP